VPFSSCSLAASVIVVFCAGCTGAGGSLGTLQTQNRSLLEQNRAQIAEIENLKSHSRRLEDKLIDAEQNLALMEDQMRATRGRLAVESDAEISQERSARQNARDGESAR
jgi:hypothetical protein